MTTSEERIMNKEKEKKPGYDYFRIRNSMFITRFPKIIAILPFILFFIASGTSFSEEPEATENVCIMCHIEMEEAILKDPVADWSASVHKKAGVSCENCHGGDPTDFEMAMDPASGYKGKPAKKDIPALCGSCHSDIERMRKFNIRTDQFDSYKTSKHGIGLLQKGDEKVASCVDCHSNHKVLSKNDPKSPVYRFNVPETCSRCHSNKELMTQYNKPHNQLELYKDSVHGKRLYEQQNLRVPTCPDCHGTHGAKPPGVKEVSVVCSNCHSMIADYYSMSPHAKPDSEDYYGGVSKKPTCVNCHSNHGIQKPTAEKFSSNAKHDCGSCHEANTEAFKRGITIQGKIITAQNSLDEVNAMLLKLKTSRGSGFETSEIENQLDKAHTNMVESVSTTHSMSLKIVDEKLEKVLKISTAVKEDINAKFVDLNNRFLWLIGSWGVILVIVFFVGKLRKTMPH